MIVFIMNEKKKYCTDTYYALNKRQKQTSLLIMNALNLCMVTINSLRKVKKLNLSHDSKINFVPFLPVYNQCILIYPFNVYTYPTMIALVMHVVPAFDMRLI